MLPFQQSSLTFYIKWYLPPSHLAPYPVLTFFITPITTHGELHSLVCMLLFPLRRWALLDQELSSVPCSIPND